MNHSCVSGFGAKTTHTKHFLNRRARWASLFVKEKRWFGSSAALLMVKWHRPLELPATNNNFFVFPLRILFIIGAAWLIASDKRVEKWRIWDESKWLIFFSRSSSGRSSAVVALAKRRRKNYQLLFWARCFAFFGHSLHTITLSIKNWNKYAEDPCGPNDYCFLFHLSRRLKRSPANVISPAPRPTTHLGHFQLSVSIGFCVRLRMAGNNNAIIVKLVNELELIVRLCSYKLHFLLIILSSFDWMTRRDETRRTSLPLATTVNVDCAPVKVVRASRTLNASSKRKMKYQNNWDNWRCRNTGHAAAHRWSYRRRKRHCLCMCETFFGDSFEERCVARKWDRLSPVFDQIHLW